MCVCFSKVYYSNCYDRNTCVRKQFYQWNCWCVGVWVISHIYTGCDLAGCFVGISFYILFIYTRTFVFGHSYLKHTHHVCKFVWNRPIFLHPTQPFLCLVIHIYHTVTISVSLFALGLCGYVLCIHTTPMCEFGNSYISHSNHMCKFVGAVGGEIWLFSI